MCVCVCVCVCASTDIDSGGTAGYCFDWMANILKGKMVPMVHLGFYKSFLKVAHFIRDILLPRIAERKVKEVNIVGHSLGGAIASLLYAYFLEAADIDALVREDVRVTLFTIGQPRVGNSTFVRTVEKIGLPLRRAKLLKSFRMICNLDLVPALPMYALGFRHFGKPALMYQVDDDDLRLLFGIQSEHKDADAEKSSCANCFRVCCSDNKPWNNTRFEDWIKNPKDLITNHLCPSYYSRCVTVDKEHHSSTESSVDVVRLKAPGSRGGDYV